ncbi:MAG: phosphohydrolase [Desulfosarcina sp.]|nr:phosphohydrolase [Desulfosarcina sp.]MBC2765595.1 phosphohydrolase [Desulfosarcina sp.]
MNPEAIITRFYPGGSRTRDLLLRHGELVVRKALEILDRAPWLDADREFVVQAAMLHDIGIGRTRCPKLGCTGTLPYVDQVLRRKLPLPARDMFPLSVEERLICYADKFYSKTDNGRHEKTIDEITAGLARYEAEYADRFLTLHRMFTYQ